MSAIIQYCCRTPGQPREHHNFEEMTFIPPRSASWIEEMEKRSRRRTRDPVTQAAFQGLSESEIGCARISMMARSTNAPFKGRIQMCMTYPFHLSHLTCNARPVHTVGSIATETRCPSYVRLSVNLRHNLAAPRATRWATLSVRASVPLSVRGTL